MGEDNGGDGGVQGRASAFFLIIGFGLLVLFYLSDKYGSFNLWYFVAGAATMALGVFLFARRPKNEVQSQRFAGIRRWSANRKAKKEAREKAKAEKQAKKQAKAEAKRNKQGGWFYRGKKN